MAHVLKHHELPDGTTLQLRCGWSRHENTTVHSVVHCAAPTRPHVPGERDRRIYDKGIARVSADLGLDESQTVFTLLVSLVRIGALDLSKLAPIVYPHPSTVR